MLWNEIEVGLHNIVNVLNATGSVTLKCLTFCYVNFTSVRKNELLKPAMAPHVLEKGSQILTVAY